MVWDARRKEFANVRHRTEDRPYPIGDVYGCRGVKPEQRRAALLRLRSSSAAHGDGVVAGCGR
eukprot:5308654-Prymnesium_polylepis.1